MPKAVQRESKADKRERRSSQSPRSLSRTDQLGGPLPTPVAQQANSTAAQKMPEAEETKEDRRQRRQEANGLPKQDVDNRSLQDEVSLSANLLIAVSSIQEIICNYRPLKVPKFCKQAPVATD